MKKIFLVLLLVGGILAQPNAQCGGVPAKIEMELPMYDDCRIIEEVEQKGA